MLAQVGPPFGEELQAGEAPLPGDGPVSPGDGPPVVVDARPLLPMLLARFIELSLPPFFFDVGIVSVIGEVPIGEAPMMLFLVERPNAMILQLPLISIEMAALLKL